MVIKGFFLQCQRVGARSRWHTPKANLLSVNPYYRVTAYCRFFATEVCHYGVGGLLPRCRYCLALRHLLQKQVDVGGVDNLEELVRGVFLEPSNLAGCVVEGYPLLCTELYNALFVEALLSFCLKVVLVAKEYVSHNAPHIVYPVGVEEFHRPTCLWWRETAEHKYFCILWQKWL